MNIIILQSSHQSYKRVSFWSLMNSARARHLFWSPV